MKFIEIQKDLFVDPAEISIIKLEKDKKLSIVVGGKKMMVNMNVKQILDRTIASPDLSQQFGRY